jgi:hypothetical protein
MMMVLGAVDLVALRDEMKQAVLRNKDGDKYMLLAVFCNSFSKIVTSSRAATIKRKSNPLLGSVLRVVAACVELLHVPQVRYLERRVDHCFDDQAFAGSPGLMMQADLHQRFAARKSESRIPFSCVNQSREFFNTVPIKFTGSLKNTSGDLPSIDKLSQDETSSASARLT